MSTNVRLWRTVVVTWLAGCASHAARTPPVARPLDDRELLVAGCWRVLASLDSVEWTLTLTAEPLGRDSAHYLRARSSLPMTGAGLRGRWSVHLVAADSTGANGLFRQLQRNFLPRVSWLVGLSADTATVLFGGTAVGTVFRVVAHNDSLTGLEMVRSVGVGLSPSPLAAVRRECAT